MHIREYQAWLEEWDRVRSWDKVLVSHTLLHAVEELGEVSRLVQILDGYRSQEDRDEETVREQLALELSDLQVFLFKIAYQCGIDMERAMIRGQEKANQRFPDPAVDAAEQEAYWKRLQQQVRRIDPFSGDDAKALSQQHADKTTDHPKHP